jgi:hypothetical protein
VAVSYPVTKFAILLGSSLTLSACGGSSTPAQEPAPARETPSALSKVAVEEEGALSDGSEAKPQPVEVKLTAAMPPNECAAGEPCVPPRAFAQAVCEGRFPGLAVQLFEKSTPWERRYIKVESLDPVNTYGGATTTERLVFTEEVLILHRQSPSGDGLQVSGASDVDVLRWDGTCVTVREEYLSVHRMPTVENATVTWRYLDEKTQEGLLAAKYVHVRYTQQRDACRNSSATRLSPVCEKATEKLNDAITVAVRGGLEFPTPSELPLWKPAE